MMRPPKQLFSGCLLGQALGDAIGFLVEGADNDACEAFVRRGFAPETLADQARGEYPFGQYSDETQLARELMLSIVTLGRFSPADYAKRLAILFADRRILGRGRATGAAARRLRNGVHWRNAGEPAPLAGNGAAMRAAPIGLAFFDRTEAITQYACEQALITHQDPRSQAGAVAVAGAVALALQPGPLDVDLFVMSLARLVRPVHEDFAKHIRKLAEWSKLDRAAALREIQFLGVVEGDGVDISRWKGISPYVIPNVLWSLYAFLHAPDDYLDAVATAIRVGGDVDTTASVTGAIAGARLGLDALPEELVALLNDGGAWRRDDLVALAERCHDFAVPSHAVA